MRPIIQDEGPGTALCYPQPEALYLAVIMDHLGLAGTRRTHRPHETVRQLLSHVRNLCPQYVRALTCMNVRDVTSYVGESQRMSPGFLRGSGPQARTERYDQWLGKRIPTDYGSGG